MKYGMPTMLEFPSLEENIKHAVEVEASFIELNINSPCIEQELKGQKAINILNKYNLEYTLHYYDEADFGLDYELVESYITTFYKWVDICAQLGIKSINIHLNPGRVVTIEGKKNYMNENYFDVYINNLTKNIQLLNEYAQKHNIILTIENIKSTKHVRDSYPYIYKYRLTYDVGHDFTTGNNLYEIIKSGNLYEMHLHDSINGNPHITLGEGESNLNKYLELCNKDTYILIEVKEYQAYKKSIDWLKKNGLYNNIR